ncbi:uncharacterized protein CC84DRAFT_870116 [Paraphaeosphaeria sporulosa]|uniref:Uncharacterized protein n=1 Tax=Paraphaeosphaeria sporulosa TaxID=1460663 RepID=A0A177C8I1_9PLEO|nr:uncharacterized protein CC84DRAFT_870116 [Paraphaeosphaeria sporulosa]OAG03855.1 hypothetical protein CC84DRAFT_870116 [Paraphaeosphaeria sporulosa]
MSSAGLGVQGPARESQHPPEGAWRRRICCEAAKAWGNEVRARDEMRQLYCRRLMPSRRPGDTTRPARATRWALGPARACDSASRNNSRASWPCNIWRADVGVAPESSKRAPSLRSSAAGPTRSWMQVFGQLAILFPRHPSNNASAEGQRRSALRGARASDAAFPERPSCTTKLNCGPVSLRAHPILPGTTIIAAWAARVARSPKCHRGRRRPPTSKHQGRGTKPADPSRWFPSACPATSARVEPRCCTRDITAECARCEPTDVASGRWYCDLKQRISSPVSCMLPSLHSTLACEGR